MADGPIDYGRFEDGFGVNYWELDPPLRAEAERLYPDGEWAWAEERLDDLGAVTGGPIAENAEEIDRQGHELRTYDEMGEVQNHVEYHPLQHENDRLAYSRGVVSDAFSAPEGRDDPVGLQHTLTMQTILCMADAGFVCPVSMTSGAAIVLQQFGDGEYEREYLERLTTRDLDEHVEGAMFLTEKQGGSDVGANEVRAEPTDEDRVYELYGEKWFCSNIDAEGTLALARRPDAPEGTAGLSMFIVPHTKRNGELNDQLYRRLKDKLGTIAVPTGEVEFRGAEAYLVGEAEEGFRYMAEMMNFERLTQATGSVGGIGRALLESKIYAADREAFGDAIDQYPLMRRDLVDMQVDYEGGLAFTFEAARWYDQYKRSEGFGPGEDSVTEDTDTAFKLFRLLVPIAKYKLARMGVDVTSYACEVKGGNGYVNGFVTERLLRDAQVGPIWEGTSNILSLDVLRVLNKEAAHEALFPFVRERIEAAEHPHLVDLAETVEAEFADLQEALVALAGEDPEYAQHEAKQLADYIFDVVTAALLLERAQEQLDDGDARKALVAEWFVETRFRQRDARGITDGRALPDEHFDEIVHFAPLSPDELVDAAPADD
ncbi:MAG: acyl-CoA dehydrogenase family protein [Haloarculaceae archaeon]